MQHSTYSDLALGLLIAGIPADILGDHFPIRHMPEFYSAIDRRAGLETVDRYTPAMAEALDGILRLLSDAQLRAARSFELSATIEADILAEALDAEADARNEALSLASNGGMSYDETDEDELGILDWDDYGDGRASDWDDLDPIPAWDTDEDDEDASL